MMQHADLMDVFRAFSGAASPFLQQETAKLKERNDLELKNTADRFTTDFQNYIRDKQFNGDYKGYMEEMQDFAGKWYDTAAEQNTSPYFQKNIQQMKTASLESARDIAMKKEDVWRQEQSLVDAEKNIEAYIDSDKTIEQKIQAIQTQNTLLWEQVPFGPADREKWQQKYYTALYTKTLNKEIALARTADDAEHIAGEVRGAFEELMPKSLIPAHGADGGDAEGNIEQPWTFDKKDEFEKETVKQAIGLIQQRNFNLAATANAEREQDIQDYRVRAAAGDVAGATALFQKITSGAYEGKTWEQWRSEIRENRGRAYAGERAPQLRGMFGEFLPGETGSGSGGWRSGSLTNINQMLDLLIGNGLDKGILGEGFNFEEAIKGIQEEAVRYLEGQGFTDEDERELLFGTKLRTERLFSMFGSHLQWLDTNFQSEVFEPLKAAVGNIAAESRLEDEAKRLLINQTIANVCNRIQDSGLRQLSNEQWLEWGKQEARKAVSGEVWFSYMRNDPSRGTLVENLSGIGDTARRIEILRQAWENPHSLNRQLGEVQYMGHREDFEAFQEKTRQDVARLLGIGDLATVGAEWMNSNGDASPVPLIRVTEGPKQGTYLQKVVTEGGRDKIATLKYNAATGEYDIPVSTETAEQMDSRERSEAREAELREAVRREVRSWADRIANSADQRSIYTSAMLAFTRAYTPAQYDMRREELDTVLRARGIDPGIFAGGR